MVAIANKLVRKGPLLESYGNVQIYDGFPYKLYVVRKDDFTGKQTEFIEFLTNAIKRSYSIEELKSVLPIKRAEEFAELFNSEIIQTVEVNQLLTRLPSPEVYNQLRNTFMGLFNEYFPDIKDKEKIILRILGEAIGYGKLTPLITDDNLEEIMINGKAYPCH
ncbi:MAG: hypothetical protein J7L44_02405 [Candidatus Diapherotrites archaeon]|nr:hypothetical protein [Candidatus Diapherotrites archaeon]